MDVTGKVCRKSNAESDTLNMTGTIKHDDGSVMVLRCIAAPGVIGGVVDLIIYVNNFIPSEKAWGFIYL